MAAQAVRPPAILYALGDPYSGSRTTGYSVLLAVMSNVKPQNLIRLFGREDRLGPPYTDFGGSSRSALPSNFSERTQQIRHSAM